MSRNVQIRYIRRNQNLYYTNDGFEALRSKNSNKFKIVIAVRVFIVFIVKKICKVFWVALN